jgi:hypothetical protein
MFARGYARLGDAVCCAGMLADAVLCAAHARMAARREWVLNEKQLVQRCGLGAAQEIVGRAGRTTVELTHTVATIATALGIEPLTAR